MVNLDAGERLCRVDIHDLEAFTQVWRNHRAALRWNCPFVLPPWIDAWRSVFGQSVQPFIAMVREGETVVGIAPLMLQDKTLRFMGDPEICDNFDCITAPDKEPLFFAALFEELTAMGFKDLELGPVRPDSAVRQFFSTCEPPQNVDYIEDPGGVIFEADLPRSWDEFLLTLSGKERHELRRKLRRLDQTGSVRFRRVYDAERLPEAVEVFLKLFVMNREEKAAFMTDRMTSYFRVLAFALAEEGLLKLFQLDVDGRPAASVFCFDYLGTRYLYNNGYDNAYRELSVGLISKAMSIQDAIDNGLQSYSFLKGAEPYKRRLGGKEVPLSRYRITLI
jgi:CelD/BcsL family acetyltransferase involved in cellulose biosynthesis